MHNLAIDRLLTYSSSSIAFLVSFSLHLGVCLGFAVMLIGGTGGGAGNGGSEFTVSAPGEDAAAEGLELSEADTPSTWGEVEEELPEIPLDAAMLNSEVPVVLASHGPLATRKGDEFSQSLAAALGSGGGSFGEGIGDSEGDGHGTATFFGARAQGKRFVFVVDSSSSMIGPRWSALCYELENVLKTLRIEQEFFIISFDESPHPIFGDFPPDNKFLHPTKDSIDRVKKWLLKVEPYPSTRPARSIEMALSMRPDAVFLLSDGEIMDNTIQELRMYNAMKASDRYHRQVPIHTILLDSAVGFRTLEIIAEENHGTFTPVRL